VPERGSLKGVQVSVLTRIGMIMHWHALFYSLFWKNIYMRFCSIKLFNFVTEHMDLWALTTNHSENVFEVYCSDW
jgi:hypothetical protein